MATRKKIKCNKCGAFIGMVGIESFPGPPDNECCRRSWADHKRVWVYNRELYRASVLIDTVARFTGESYEDITRYNRSNVRVPIRRARTLIYICAEMIGLDDNAMSTEMGSSSFMARARRVYREAFESGEHREQVDKILDRCGLELV